MRYCVMRKGRGHGPSERRCTQGLLRHTQAATIPPIPGLQLGSHLINIPHADKAIEDVAVQSDLALASIVHGEACRRWGMWETFGVQGLLKARVEPRRHKSFWRKRASAKALSQDLRQDTASMSSSPNCSWTVPCANLFQ